MSFKPLYNSNLLLLLLLLLLWTSLVQIAWDQPGLGGTGWCVWGGGNGGDSEKSYIGGDGNHTYGLWWRFVYGVVLGREYAHLYVYGSICI